MDNVPDRERRLVQIVVSNNKKKRARREINYLRLITP